MSIYIYTLIIIYLYYRQLERWDKLINHNPSSAASWSLGRRLGVAMPMPRLKRMGDVRGPDVAAAMGVPYWNKP